MRQRHAQLLRARIPREDPTPGAMAVRLDAATVQTPALRIVDAELIAIRDAVKVMLARRTRFAELVGPDDSGDQVEAAIAQSAAEIPSAGNDRLLLSMPPQEGKTERLGHRGLLWLLRQFPELRIGIVSYDGDHAARISYMVRADIELFDGTGDNPDLGLRLAKNQKAISRWLLRPPAGGGMYAIGIGGGLTGRPIDVLLIDDPVKDVKTAESVKLSHDAWEWWQTVARPRLAPWAPVIVDGTRWHELDLIGRLLLKQEEDESAGIEHFDRWRQVNIPAQADHDPEAGETDILGREPGEFMVSARGRTRAQWEATKTNTSPRFWSALFQGRPAPADGTVWLKPWWHRYSSPVWSQHSDGSYRVTTDFSLMQSWDFAFKDTDTSDYVCGQVWAKRDAEAYLLYQRWARLSFVDTLDAMLDVFRLWPQARKIVVEEKANGSAVISSMKRKLPGIVGCEPTTSKKARAEAVSHYIRAGNVLVPTMGLAVSDPAIAWDPEGFIHEATVFPNGANDDQVDAASQALAELYLGPGGVGEILTVTPEVMMPRSLPGTRVPVGRPRGPVLSPHQARLTREQLRRTRT